jgi:uncharacterized cofD-like protein
VLVRALTEITGDFPDAVRSSAEVLKIAGRIFPSTATNVVLEALLDDGKVVRGETRISQSRRPIRGIRLQPNRVRPLKETLEAIAGADLITMGPGSLFTSVIPNLLVSGIPKAIRQSRALKAYFGNLMTQPGETTNFSASDHVLAIYGHAGGKLLDSVVVSTSPISPAVRRRYAEQNAEPIRNDTGVLERMGLEVIGEDLLQKGQRVLRHNPAAIARVAVELAVKSRKLRHTDR